ncbi:hypothetical protein PG997_004392 [Apiospora hydei]|uniref:Uncharacterized protein n=1 Tax=Apiospora hydei TaxID=1337664 RepID=A0ABR1X214_9PEZI
MFPRPLRRLLKLVVLFIPVFVACNTITLLILQRGMAGLKTSTTAAHETETKGQLPVLGVSPHTDRALAHEKQHPEPGAAPPSLEPETHPATAGVYDTAEEKDPKPETTLTAPEQTHQAGAGAGAIVTEVQINVDDTLRETPKGPGTTMQLVALSTQRVFNTSTT